MRPIRLLLINPTHGATFWGLDYSVGLAGCDYTIAPLALATVAALTPSHWSVRIVDENVEPVDLDEPCDVVGITAMNVQASRAFALAAELRRRGRLVVMGGPFATLQPERVAPHVDVVVTGEAERTWPAFCRDVEQGTPKRSYVEAEAVDLATSPVPRYDLLRRGAYAALPLQTTRGCPFECEFCDIIVMQGRRVRAKPVENVLREVEALRAAGGRSVFFTDDNFVGNQRYARTLLEALEGHRERTGFAPPLFTQASVNLADKPALLEAMVRGGFTRVFLGIESPRQASLREAGKRQNTHGELLDRVRTIQRAGLMVWAGMIVGFDHDDEAIFREQADFIDEAAIPVAMIGMLNAPPRTPLFARLARDGRIDPGSDWADNCAWTNIVPARMTREQLFRGYGELIRHVYDQRRYADRVLANIARMAPSPAGATAARRPELDDLRDLWRATASFTFSRSAERRRHFLPNLLRVVTRHPSRLVEAAIHLGIWQHFERYVPEVVERLEAALGARPAERATLVASA